MEICIVIDENKIVQGIRYMTKGGLIAQQGEKKIDYTGDIPVDFLVGKKYVKGEFVDVQTEEENTA
jgi:hypothetical protein